MIHISTYSSSFKQGTTLLFSLCAAWQLLRIAPGPWSQAQVQTELTVPGTRRTKPVALKNPEGTCWLSSITQSLEAMRSTGKLDGLDFTKHIAWLGYATVTKLIDKMDDTMLLGLKRFHAAMKSHYQNTMPSFPDTITHDHPFDLTDGGAPTQLITSLLRDLHKTPQENSPFTFSYTYSTVSPKRQPTSLSLIRGNKSVEEVALPATDADNSNPLESYSMVISTHNGYQEEHQLSDTSLEAILEKNLVKPKSSKQGATLRTLPNLLVITNATQGALTMPEYLDMTPYMSHTQERYNYRLLVCTYFVPICLEEEGFHTIAYTRRGNTWYYCNDENIKATPAYFDTKYITHTEGYNNIEDVIQKYARTSKGTEFETTMSPMIMIYERIDKETPQKQAHATPRVKHAPVAIKNSAGTCWLSSITQSLEALRHAGKLSNLSLAHTPAWSGYRNTINRIEETGTEKTLNVKHLHAAMEKSYQGRMPSFPETVTHDEPFDVITDGYTTELFNTLLRDLHTVPQKSPFAFSYACSTITPERQPSSLCLARGAQEPVEIALPETEKNNTNPSVAYSIAINNHNDQQIENQLAISSLEAILDKHLQTDSSHYGPRLQTLPDVLVITNTTTGSLTYPEYLDMNDYLANTDGRYHYRLLACMYHLPITFDDGNIGYHAIAYARRGDIWYYCNDDIIHPTPAYLDTHSTTHTHGYTTIEDIIQKYATTSHGIDFDTTMTPMVMIYERISEKIMI